MKELAILIFCIAAFNAQAQPDARQILLKADSATAQLKTARYYATFKLQPVGGQKLITTEGTVVFKRLNDTADMLGAKLYLEGSFPWEDKKLYQSYYYNGSTVFTLRLWEKKAVLYPEKLEPVQAITGDWFGPLAEIVIRKSNYVIEPTAMHFQYLGKQEIQGIECHKIGFNYPDNGILTDIQYIFYVGNDYIIRRCENSVNIGGELQTSEVTISNLETNIPVSDDTFEAAIPANFTQEEFSAGKRPELLTIGDTAPDWALKDPTGRTISLADYRGKIVLLDFWFRNCFPCLKAIPELQKIHENFKSRGVEVIGVHCYDANNKNPEGVMARMKANYQIAVGGDAVAKLYNVSSYPTMYVIGPDGKILMSKNGYDENLEKELAEKIEGFLQKK